MKIYVLAAVVAMLAVLPRAALAQTEEDVAWAKLKSATICNRIFENEQFFILANDDIKKQYAEESLRHETVRADLAAQSPLPAAELREENALHAKNMQDITSRRNMIRDEYDEERRLIDAEMKKFRAEMEYRARIAPATGNRRNFYDSTVKHGLCSVLGSQ